MAPMAVILFLIFFLLSNALTMRRDIAVLYNRMSILVLIYCLIIDLSSLSVVTKGVGLHGGLLISSNLTQIFHILIYIICIFILSLTSFYLKKVLVKEYSSLKDILFYTIQFSGFILFYYYLELKLDKYYNKESWSRCPIYSAEVNSPVENNSNYSNINSPTENNSNPSNINSPTENNSNSSNISSPSESNNSGENSSPYQQGGYVTTLTPEEDANLPVDQLNDQDLQRLRAMAEDMIDDSPQNQLGLNDPSESASLAHWQNRYTQLEFEHARRELAREEALAEEERIRRELEEGEIESESEPDDEEGEIESEPEEDIYEDPDSGIEDSGSSVSEYSIGDSGYSVSGVSVGDSERDGSSDLDDNSENSEGSGVNSPGDNVEDSEGSGSSDSDSIAEDLLGDGSSDQDNNSQGEGSLNQDNKTESVSSSKKEKENKSEVPVDSNPSEVNTKSNNGKRPKEEDSENDNPPVKRFKQDSSDIVSDCDMPDIFESGGE